MYKLHAHTHTHTKTHRHTATHRNHYAKVCSTSIFSLNNQDNIGSSWLPCIHSEIGKIKLRCQAFLRKTSGGETLTHCECGWR